MARLSKETLLNRITDALDQGGWNYIIRSADHPFELSVFLDGKSFRTRIYIWNITHGGGSARAANEYRIQITSGVTQFDVTGVDRTLVLGWWEEVGAFAAFDVTKHLGALGASPSLQIQREALDHALRDQMATQRKGNEEIAIAFAPQFLGDYIEQLPSLHQIAQSDTDLRVLDEVIADPEEAEAVVGGATSEPRRIVLTTVARKLRDASFMGRVLNAYTNQCAMCGVQLRLVDAAHIVPVETENNDATSNGLALCALHHRAFDRALVTIVTDFKVAVNPRKVRDLTGKDLHRGLDKFRQGLRPTIILPPTRGDRPSADSVRKANQLRGWIEFDLIA